MCKAYREVPCGMDPELSVLNPSQMSSTWNWQSTHGSNTSRVMYSLGMRGSWWEKTFWRPTSHIRMLLLGFWFSEFPMTWNSITPLRSSSRAASSRAECADSRLVWGRGRVLHDQNRAGHCSSTESFTIVVPYGYCCLFCDMWVFGHVVVTAQYPNGLTVRVVIWSCSSWWMVQV